MQSSKTLPPRTHLFQFIQARRKQESGLANLQYPTDFNFRDVHGMSLLDYAIEAGDEKEVKELVENCGVSVNNVSEENENSTDSPLLRAIKKGHLRIAQYLYKNGADCHTVMLSFAPTKEVKSWLQSITKDGSTDRQTLSKTQRAAERGDIDYFVCLNAQDRLNKYISGSDETNPHRLKFSLVSLAALNGHLDLVSFLIKNNFPPDPVALYVESPLQMAIMKGHFSIADYLISKGANLSWENSLKQNALMTAIIKNKTDAIQFLLKRNIGKTSVDKDGNTIFHLVAQTGNKIIFNLLVDSLNPMEKDLLLNSKNLVGETPYNIAVELGHSDLVAYLPEDGGRLTPQKNIAQEILLEKISYYLRVHYRDASLLSLNGVCNGLSYLYFYYSERKMQDYFFNTLMMISNWDGQLETLNQPFEEIPQKQYYNNLKELIEQWTNDIIWFQAKRNLAFTSQDDRETQYRLVKNEEGLQPISTYSSFKSGAVFFNRAQIFELLHWFSKMPPGTNFQVTSSCHTVSLRINENSEMDFYDANNNARMQPFTNVKTMIEVLIDNLYISTKNYPRDGKEFTFKGHFFYFLQNEKSYEYSIFSELDYPKTIKDAKRFQKKSPNQLTPLHVAVIANSMPALQRLLKDGFCNINALNRFDESALGLATSINNTKMIELLKSYGAKEKNSAFQFSFLLSTNKFIKSFRKKHDDHTKKQKP